MKLEMRCLKFQKLLTAVLCLMLLTIFSPAYAAEVSASVLPVSMISAGDGTITITLKNTNEPAEDGSGTAITDISITPSIPDVYFDTAGASIAPGESKSFSAACYFSEEMLNTSLSFTVSYTEGTRARSKDVSVKVLAAKTSSVTLTRSASTKQASPGEEITLTYRISNTGDAPITVTSLVDREIGGKDSMLKEKQTIEAGASAEVQYVYKMGKSTVTSEPKVTYKDTVTKEEGTASAAAITLGMVNSRISVEVIQGEATAAGVTFTLNLTNNGNQKISDIKITDDQGNRVNGDSFALAIGENRQLTYNVVTEEERYVTFSITGVTTSGDKYEDKTKSYVVRKYIDPDLLGIQFTAAVTETLNSAGSIGVRFDINNTGTMTMTNLVISMEEAYTDENGAEQTKLNEIYRTDVVPTGSFETTQTVYVGEPRDLTFAVQMNDPAGNPYTYTAHIKAEVLGVRNVQETDDAQQSAISTLGATVGDSISKALTIALIVLAVLTVISVIAMAVLTSLEKKQRREAARRRAARERQMRREQRNRDSLS